MPLKKLGDLLVDEYDPLLQISIPIDYQNVGLNQNLSKLRIMTDQNKNVLGLPVIPLNPITGFPLTTESDKISSSLNYTQDYGAMLNLTWIQMFPAGIANSGKLCTVYGMDITVTPTTRAYFANYNPVAPGIKNYYTTFQGVNPRQLIFPSPIAGTHGIYVYWVDAAPTEVIATIFYDLAK